MVQESEELSNKAKELLDLSSREIMALALSKNEKWADNYQVAMTINIREEFTLSKEGDNKVKEFF